jgi:DNA-binding NarL/FixJ family response regulator
MPRRRSANTNRRSRHVVIVDDHPLIRRGLERLINSGERFHVAGEAGTAAESLEVLRDVRPAVVILDITLPDKDGIELTKEIVAKFPQTNVLIFSMHDDSDHATRAFHAGATGYMVKSDAVEKIETALEEVRHGRRYLSDSVAARLA